MYGMRAISDETRAALAKAILQGTRDGSLKKTIDIAEGLTGVSLDAPAKQLIPLMSPFRQSIPRTVKPGSASSDWKAITGLSAPKLSAAEATAGVLMTQTTVPKSATYRINRLGGKVTREAEAQSRGFDPALAKESANVLLNFMKLEEQVILGGNRTALAAPTNLAVAVITGGGSLPAEAAGYFVQVAAITLQAANQVSLDRPDAYDGTHANVTPRSGGITPALLDVTATGYGIGPLAAEVNSAAVSLNDRLKITWDPVPNAGGYLVYVGNATGPANLELNLAVSQTSVTIKNVDTGGETADNHVNTSADTLTYDGIIPLLNAAGSGAYIKAINNKLTGAATDGEIVELGDMFQSLWDNAKIGRYRLVMAGQESRSVTARGATSQQLTILSNPQESGRGEIVFGAHVGQVINPVSGDLCPVEVVPWMPGGSILALPMEIPYADANTTTAFDMAMQYDTERWDYGTARSDGPIWTFDVQNYGVLRDLVPGGCGYIYNIFKG